MNKKFEQSDAKKYVILALVLVIVALSFFLIRPFIVYPVYRDLSKNSKRPSWIAISLISVFLILFFIAGIFLIRSLTSETYITYITIKQKLLSGELFPTACVKSFFCDISQSINAFLFDPVVRAKMQEFGIALQNKVVNYGQSFLLNLPRKFIDIGIFCVLLFYFIRDGEKIVTEIKKLLPLEERHQNHLFTKTKNIVYGILYGQFLTAIIQGFLGAIIFYLMGINGAIFWGSMIALFGILPIGTSLIWFPAGLLMIYDGILTSNNVVVTKGIILLILGILIVTFIDNLLKYYWMGTKAKAHTAIILLGVVGGLFLFGFIGIFIGPLILTLLMTVFEFYAELKHAEENGRKGKAIN